MNTPSLIKMFTTSVDYDDAAKDVFHRVGRNVMRNLAKELRLSPGEFEVRSNRGGIAVSGEVTLHCDWMYVELSQGYIGKGACVMFRTVEGRKDYHGGRNHFAEVEEWLDLPTFAARLKATAAREISNGIRQRVSLTA